MVGDSADDDTTWPININKLTAAQSDVERLRGLAFHSLREPLRRIRQSGSGRTACRLALMPTPAMMRRIITISGSHR